MNYLTSSLVIFFTLVACGRCTFSVSVDMYIDSNDIDIINDEDIDNYSTPTPTPTVTLTPTVTPTPTTIPTPTPIYNSTILTIKPSSSSISPGALSAIIISAVCAIISGIIGFVFWKCQKRSEVKVKMKSHSLANQVREQLNLGIDNFESQRGMEFVRLIEKLEKGLNNGGVSTTTITQQNDVAEKISTVIQRRKLLVKVRCCCYKNRLLSDKFEGSIPSLVGDIIVIYHISYRKRLIRAQSMMNEQEPGNPREIV
jgi:hypothetical protein